MTDVKTTLSDTALTAKIKSHFLIDDQINVLDISVTTSKGHVILSGKVPTNEIAAYIVSVTESIDGVVKVIDRLVVVDVLE